MVTSIDITKINKSFDKIERQRNAIRARINSIRETFMATDSMIAALQSGSWESKLQELSKLEEQLVLFDKFIEEKQQQQRRIFLAQLQQELELSDAMLTQAEQREAALLREIDQLFAQLEQKGKQLATLRRETLTKVPLLLGELKSLESKLFLERVEKFGTISGDLYRFFFTYQRLRGRVGQFEDPSSW